MEIIIKYDTPYPSYEIRVDANTSLVNSVRSIVSREMDYANQLYDLGKYILEPVGDAVKKFPIGDPKLYIPSAKDIMWNYENGDSTIDNSVEHGSIDDITVTLARFKELFPQTSWSQLACIAFWMLHNAESYHVQFVQYKLFIEKVNPFTSEQAAIFDSAPLSSQIISKFPWPILTSINETTLDLLRKAYAQCVVDNNADIVNQNWYCVGIIKPPTCPSDVSIDYISEPKGTPTIYNTVSVAVMNPNRAFFEWLNYDTCVLENATSTISSSPQICQKPNNLNVDNELPSSIRKSMRNYYFTAAALTTVAVGLVIWSFLPKNAEEKAEKEYKERVRRYSPLSS